MAMGAGPEFDRIRQIAAVLGGQAAPLGDDCALLKVGDRTLALSTDVCVEGTHFRREWITPEEFGWKAAASALSDLAAAGAEPIGLLAAMTSPANAAATELTSAMQGVGAAAAAAGARVLGGDLARGAQWSAAITVIGDAARPVTRSGARPGDGLWVTGVLGGARAALDAWQQGTAPEPDARVFFTRPVPRIAAGKWLASHGARAMLDISDGLGGDAQHLAAASGVALEIDAELVPVAGPAVAAAQKIGAEIQLYAAEGGEDYELLVALPAEFGAKEALEFERAVGITLTRIGRVMGGGGVKLRWRGATVQLKGFDHFR